MSLIEWLGGYENAKNTYEKLKSEITDKQKNNKIFMDSLNSLYSEMLQYRRENNIFEVGDKIVSTLEGLDDWKNTVCKILGFHKKMAITTGFSCAIHHYKYRHATPQEIEAGRRLD